MTVPRRLSPSFFAAPRNGVDAREIDDAELSVRVPCTAMNEDTLTLPPPEHDYVISFTGLSWSVRRSNGVGAFFSISEGNRDRRIAVAKVLSLAESDHTDVWETVGNGTFWRLRRFRP